MGLSINTNGHNIVFTGGTGILVFLDIVAKLVLQNCNNVRVKYFGDDFKLTLYFAAPSD